MLEHVERKLFDKSGRLVASTVTLLGGDFSMAGELMAMSILQGGPAPNVLDSSVFQYLVNRPLCPMQLPTPFKGFALKVWSHISVLKNCVVITCTAIPISFF